MELKRKGMHRGGIESTPQKDSVDTSRMKFGRTFFSPPTKAAVIHLDLPQSPRRTGSDASACQECACLKGGHYFSPSRLPSKSKTSCTCTQHNTSRCHASGLCRECCLFDCISNAGTLARLPAEYKQAALPH